MGFSEDLLIASLKARNGNSVQARTEGNSLYNTPGGYLPMFLQLPGLIDNTPPYNPRYPLLRDRYLRQFARTEPLMAGALYSLKARIMALDYKLDGPPRAKKYSHDVLMDCEGSKGVRRLLGRFVDDLLKQDNGGFIELIGGGNPTRPLKGPLRPPYMMHLDSQQCWRTFDPEYPVVYIDPLTSSYHAMHYTRVLFASMDEQPDELGRGIGFSGVSRALGLVQLMRDIQTYKREKVTGQRRGFIFGEGMNSIQVKETLDAADDVDKAKGYAVYKGIPIIARASGNVDFSLLDLASLPDNFDTETDTTLYVYALALAFGVDAREFWPATASGATKADATIQHLKAQGKGIGDLIETCEIVRQALPESVAFEFDFTDDESDLKRAEINTMHARYIIDMANAGLITTLEARTIAIDEGLLDASLLQTVTQEDVDAQGVNDSTPEDTVEEEITEIPPQDETKPPQQTVEEKALRPGNRLYERRTNDFQLALEGLMQDFIDSGRMDIGQLETDVLALMESGLTSAYGIGLSGRQPTTRGVSRLQDVADDQAGYLSGFTTDLRNAITAGAVLSPFISRLAMYAGSFWESIWMGVGDHLRQETRPARVRRVLDDRAEHCDRCPSLAREYDSFDSMVALAGLPGDGTTPCMSNCRCRVEVETSPGVWEALIGRPTVFVEPLIRLR